MELQISEWVADLRLQAKAHSRVLGDFWPGRISPGAVNWHWPALSSFHDLWFLFGGARLIWLMMCFFLVLRWQRSRGPPVIECAKFARRRCSGNAGRDVCFALLVRISSGALRFSWGCLFLLPVACAYLSARDADYETMLF